MENMKSASHPLPRITWLANGSAFFISDTEKQILRHANIVVYDDGVSDKILRFIPAHVKKIAQSTILAYSQTQVKILLVDYAFTHGHVVLLKNSTTSVSKKNIALLRYADLFNIETAFLVNDIVIRNTLTTFPPQQKFHLN
jgi:uroporphyrin-III C-methyltransferase